MKTLNKEVYVAEEMIVHVGRPDIQFLIEKVHNNERKRIRLCAHKEIDDPLHEMFIVLAKNTYIRPSYHLKEESLHILEGTADYIFLDEKGSVKDVIPLGDYSSGRRFYCRVPKLSHHTLIVRSEVMVVHETTTGPFQRTDTIFAPWAPEEGNTDGIRQLMEKIESNIAVFNKIT